MSRHPPPDEPGSNLVAQARALAAVKRFDQAILYLQRAIGADPQNYEARCLLAHTLYRAGDDTAAVQAAEAAAAIAPLEAWPHYLRAIALLHMEQTKPALQAAEEATRLEPDSPTSLSALVMVLVERGRLRDARAAAQRLIAIAPEEARSHECLGLVALRSFRWKEAEQHYRHALAIDPESALAMVNLGIALQNQWRTQEAVELAHAAAKSAPDDPWVQSQLVAAVSAHQERLPALPTLFFVVGYIVSVILVVVNLPVGTALALGVGIADATYRRRRLRSLPGPVVTFFDWTQTQLGRRATKRQWIIIGAIFSGITVAIVAMAVYGS